MGPDVPVVCRHGQTDVGRRRPGNEDAILVTEGLLVVCDGLGGHAGGEIASGLAVETIAAVVGSAPRPDQPGGHAGRLRAAIEAANAAILRRGTADPACTGMGTTVAAAILPPGSALMTYAHVGDSRIYLIRGGRRPAITALTRDDSWAEAGPAFQHILTKALGLQADVGFDVGEQPLEPGDAALLCSDGLTTMVPDDRILGLVTARAGDLEAACRGLIAEANARGGRDNISVVLARRVS
jgi:protein phosphatase